MTGSFTGKLVETGNFSEKHGSAGVVPAQAGTQVDRMAVPRLRGDDGA
ncbi:MAG: hypothetical protein AB8B64_24420 [Granulosicoccus sp.]